MEQDQPFHYGILQVPATGKLLLKKSWQEKYCTLYKASGCGKQRLEVYDNGDYRKSTSSKIITLQDCIKIVPLNEKFFSITTSSATYEFGAPTLKAMNEWVKALQFIAFPDNSSKTNVIEENEIYYASVENTFLVQLIKSPASIRCNLQEKQYMLVFTENCIELNNSHDGNVIYTWPYRFIRKYGYRDGIFNFEAGRKCSSGEGNFYFKYSDDEEIFNCISSKIKSKLKHTPKDMPPIFEENKTKSINQSPQPSSVLSEVSKPAVPKFIPAKPPRKNIPPQVANLQESIKYDEIKTRTEAWKTMGVNDVSHTETEEMYMSWGPSKKQTKPQAVVKASKIITTPHIPKNYDKLDHFGTINSFKHKGYETVNKLIVNSFCEPPSFNAYDEIEIEPTVKCEENDDKSTLKNIKQVKQPTIKHKVTQIKHQFEHGDCYAVVSKPKTK